MSVVLLITGGVLFLNGLVLSIWSNLNFGVIMTAGVGLFLLLWGIFYKTVKKITKRGILKAVKNIIVALLALEVIFVAFLATVGMSDSVDYNEDALVVLGAGLKGDKVTLTLQKRLDEAVAYHEKNPDAYIVVTGGQGFQETVTEACAMEKYLLAKGVSEDKILKEEKATSTNENMRFSKTILEEKIGKDFVVGVVSNSFHMYRAENIARLEGFDKINRLSAETMWYNAIPCYLRESLAVLKMWILK